MLFLFSISVHQSLPVSFCKTRSLQLQVLPSVTVLSPCHSLWDLNCCPVAKLRAGPHTLKLVHQIQFTAAYFLPLPTDVCREPTLTWGMCRNAESCNQLTVRRANEFPVPAAVAKFTFASSKSWGCSDHRDQQCCSINTSQIYSSQGRRWAWHNSLPGQTSGAALEIKHCTTQWLQPLVYATTPAQIIFLSWILVSWA